MKRTLLIPLYILAITLIQAQAPANVLLSQSSLPQGFIENKGQITDQNYKPNPAVKYLFCSPGFNVQLRATGFSYDTYTDIPNSIPDVKNQWNLPKSKGDLPKKFTRYYHRVDIELPGCNSNASIVAADSSQAYYNYISYGVSDIHFYQRVTYKNIYPYIDLEFFTGGKNDTGKGNVQIEYNFIVHPGGNPADIKLAYRGANKVRLEDGRLVINVAAGDFTENIPASYFEDNKQPVQVDYSALGNDVFSFSLPTGLGALKSDLIIDPTPNLNWGTYYGGAGGTDPLTYGYRITLDAGDNVYITGSTESTTGIATAGAYQTTYAGVWSALVAKFNANGNTLLWGTYYGGADGTDPTTSGVGIALDANDNVYITGFTGSTTGIATPGAYKTTLAGIDDAFIAKFNANGTTLLWGTYYGGLGSTYPETMGRDIALDVNNNVYIIGNTSCTSGIATPGAHQTTLTAGTEDAFVAKFNANGTSLLWSTYYGGTNGGTNSGTEGSGIALDANDNVYISGFTESTTGIATTGVYQTTLAGTEDAFVAKLNATGNTLLWGTYYGGGGGASHYAYGERIALDTGNNIYITGTTTSTTGIATTGAYQTTLVGNVDAFVAKFNTSGTTLLWGSYYGGTGGNDSTTIGYDIALDANDNVYITGCTESTTGIATPGAYQTTLAGINDAYVAKFNATGTTLLWGSYYGGASGADSATISSGIALDVNDNVYITGWTESNTGIATPGAYQTTLAGTQDAFVAKFGDCATPAAGTITGPTTLCALSTITLTDTTTGGTWASNNSQLATVNNSGIVTGGAGGVDTITYSVSNGCGTTTVNFQVTVNSLPRVNTVTNKTICAGDSSATINFTGTGTGTVYNWTCNNTSIGITANGTGNIASFIAVNTGSTPVMATVTLTPTTSAAYAYISNELSGTVSVINLATNTVVDTVNVGFRPEGVAVSRDGTKAYVCTDSNNGVSVISTATNTLVATISLASRPQWIAISPDGSRLYATMLNDSIAIINTTTNTVMGSVLVGNSIVCLATTPDGSRVYIADGVDSVSVLNTATNTIVATVIVQNHPLGIAVTPDGSKVYVTNNTSGSVSVISTATNTVITTIHVAANPAGITISPNGNMVYVANDGVNLVTVINVATNTVIGTIPGGQDPTAISVSPDGSTVYVANGTSGNVSVINTATNTVIDSIPVGSYPDGYGQFTGNSTGCTGTPITFTITVNPTPTATFTTSTGQTHFCQGDSLTLTADAETRYLWSTGATTQNITITQGGNEGVTVTDNNGCTASTSATISAFSTPTSSIVQGDTGICVGDSVTLTSASQFQYLWSTGATTQNITVKQTGTYTVQATNPVGCSAISAPVTVTVNSATTAAITPNGPTTFCQGGSVTLSAGAAGSYLWSGGATTATINVSQSGNYSVTVNGSSSCSATSTATTVTVDTLPVAIITPHGPTAFCQGLNVSLVASTGTAYMWSNGETTSFISAAQPGNYTVTVTNGYNCTAASAPTVVAVYPTGASQFSRALCPGQTISFNNQNLNQTGTYYDTLQTTHGCDSIITLNLNVNSALQTGIIDTTCSGTPYIFNGHSLTQSGVYVDTLQSAAGCDSIVRLNLAVDSTGTPTITRSGNTLSTQSYNSYQWLLNGTTPTGSTQSIVVTQNGNYSVVVTGAGGCSDTSSVMSVTTLGVQNIISDYGVKLFPNPNTGNFTLQFTDDLVRGVEITDAVGRVVVAPGKVSKQQLFNVEQLSGGVYILRIIESNETQSLKFSVLK